MSWLLQCFYIKYQNKTVAVDNEASHLKHARTLCVYQDVQGSSILLLHKEGSDVCLVCCQVFVWNVFYPLKSNNRSQKPY